MTTEKFEKNIQETNIKVVRIGYANLDSSLCSLCNWDCDFSGHFDIEFAANESKMQLKQTLIVMVNNKFTFERTIYC